MLPVRLFLYSKTVMVIYSRLTWIGHHLSDYQGGIMPVPLKLVVKTEVEPEIKLKLQKRAQANKRSMRKELELIIENAVSKDWKG